MQRTGRVCYVHLRTGLGPAQVNKPCLRSVKYRFVHLMAMHFIAKVKCALKELSLNRARGTSYHKLVSKDLHPFLYLQYEYNGKSDDRHPCPEVALSFNKGDILELLACNDDHWWQVSRSCRIFSPKIVRRMMSDYRVSGAARWERSFRQL